MAVYAVDGDVMLDGEPLQPNNYCLGEVECALGAKLLERIDSINDEKRARALRFIDAVWRATGIELDVNSFYLWQTLP